MKKNLPLSPRGATLIGGSAALIVGGIWATDGWLILLGFSGMILLTIAFVIAIFSLKNITLSLYAPSRITASIPFQLELTLHNHRRLLDSFHTEIILQLMGNNSAGGTLIKATAPWVASGSTARIQLPVTLHSRGHADTHAGRISSTFPLGLFRFDKQIQIRHQLTVTPRCITPVELNCDGSMHDALPQSGSAAGHTFGELRGIRAWQAGDSAKHIHWPASARSLARGHTLRVREYDPPGFHPDRCHIIFHSYATGGEMLRGDRFERALSLLAGSITKMQNSGIPCILTADFHDWAPIPCSSRAQLAECLSQLARVTRARGIEAHDLDTVFRKVSSDHTLIIISDMAPDSWRHLLTQHPQTLIIDIRQVRYRNQTLHAASA